MEEVIGCKIRRIGWKQLTASASETQPKDAIKTLVNTCEHRVSKNQILAWQAHYGTVESELEEDYIVDTKEIVSINQTGNYYVWMNLEHKILQLITISGLRIKIYHKGFDKLCTKCFSQHQKSDCKEESKTE